MSVLPKEGKSLPTQGYFSLAFHNFVITTL